MLYTHQIQTSPSHTKVASKPPSTWNGKVREAIREFGGFTESWAMMGLIARMAPLLRKEANRFYPPRLPVHVSRVKERWSSPTLLVSRVKGLLWEFDKPMQQDMWLGSFPSFTRMVERNLTTLRFDAVKRPPAFLKSYSNGLYFSDMKPLGMLEMPRNPTNKSTFNKS